MTKILTAIALTIALPAVAHAQAAPTPAHTMECCEKMKAAGKDCKDMAKMDHSKMDHSKMDHGKHGMKAGADPHAGHDMSGAKAPPAGTNHNH